MSSITRNFSSGLSDQCRYRSVCFTVQYKWSCPCFFDEKPRTCRNLVRQWRFWSDCVDKGANQRLCGLCLCVFIKKNIEKSTFLIVCIYVIFVVEVNSAVVNMVITLNHHCKNSKKFTLPYVNVQEMCKQNDRHCMSLSRFLSD